MTDLPDLSTWHRVPVGATIPAGTPYAYVYEEGLLTVVLNGYRQNMVVHGDAIHYYTEHPIAPPLPTEEGTTILVSSDGRPPYILVTRVDGRWANRYGVEWYDEQIRAWAPITIGETVIMP